MWSSLWATQRPDVSKSIAHPIDELRAACSAGDLHPLEHVIAADIWEPDARHVIHCAALLARNSGAMVVDRRHVLLALLEEPPLAPLWKACLPDIPGSTDALTALPFTPSTSLPRQPGASDDVLHLLDAAAVFATGAGKDSASAADLLIRLLTDEEAFAKVLSEHGLVVADAVRFACHGVREHHPFDDVSAPPGDRLDVVVFNDCHTPQESVVELLQAVFAMPQPFATKTMLDVHVRGTAVVLTAARAVAIDKVNVGLAFARERGLPIRLSLAPFAPAEARDPTTAG